MNRQTLQVQFLSPCFCAGADSSRAELRASAIRGQLRWWYRALGGGKKREEEVFGRVHGSSPLASRVIVRIAAPPRDGESDWMKRLRQGAAPAVYLLGFFCDRTNRLTRNGAIAPGAEAVVELIYRKPVDDLTKLAVRAFFSIGALGFRATRTAGAITSRQYSLDEQRWEDLKRKLETAGFKVELLRDRFGTWYELVERADKLLKEKLRGRDGLRINAGRGGSRANVLGSASPRQASAVHLRPVRIGGDLRLALLEAPHQRILGRETLRAESSRGSVVEQARRANLL